MAGGANDVFAPVDGDTGERDRLCRFHRHRDLAQIIRRNHNRLSPAWSFEAVTTPGQGSTHLTIDHFLARGRKTEHWPRSPHVHFDEWQVTGTTATPMSKRAAIMWGNDQYRSPKPLNPDIPGGVSLTPHGRGWSRGARARKSTAPHETVEEKRTTRHERGASELGQFPS